MIGMTTTGAASNMALLREIRPRIVVVEEAAQVHEQHILGCLTKDLQHLILIGDHQQLRPTMNNYDLRCQYNTDVSLMERLVMNGFPFQCLTQQHRMRPEISCMLNPAIYSSLQDHLTVLEYQDIKGINHNIFFIDHQNPENQLNHSTSYTNDFEVEMIANLYKYLILQGYSNSEITILSAYNDQVRKIRKRVSEIALEFVIGREFSTQRVHITAVDNFQGEENRIILLSLVRSNEDCKLGYLGDPQRICVAISRAKEGFYAIGNFQMLYKRRNHLWMKIITKAKEKGVLGKSLSLVCKNHPQKITSVSCPEDFENVKDGGCDEPCATHLQCGHVCERKCHADYSIHKLPCQKICLKRWCKDGHLCQKKCYEVCGPCMERVKKKYPTCEHKVCVPCSEDLSDRPCPAKCTRQRDCGHPCTLRCSQNCNEHPCQVVVQVTHPICGHETMIRCSAKDNFSCQNECRAILSCGHSCQGNCHRCSNGKSHIPCKQVCSRKFVCGHDCELGHPCSSLCPPCEIVIKVTHPNCSHESMIKCSTKNNFPCQKECRESLSCGHYCQGSCYSCSNGRLHIPCKQSCSRVLICGHDCKIIHPCSRMCPPCTQKCERMCEHREGCPRLCGETCEPCTEKCNWKCNRECKNSFKCSKQCFEDCNRPPCSNRCKKTLKDCNFRHRCSGICGETCPRFCKRCNKDQLQEMFSESKQNEKALFIELVDCGHIFDLDAMDRHMQFESSDESNKERQVVLKKCPKCSTPIKRSNRYRNINNQIFRDLEGVKRKIEKGEINMFHSKYWNIESFQEMTTRVPIFVKKCIESLMPKKCENVFVRTLLTYFISKARPRLRELQKASREPPPEIKEAYSVIVKWIRCHSNIMFTDGELRQFANEVERCLLYSDLILMKRDFDGNGLKNITQTDKELLECQIIQLKCIDGRTFELDDIVRAKLLFDELRRKEAISCSWISDGERRINLKNVACTKQGQWYKCTKSHIYSIGFFVDTSDEPQCPECRLSIKNSNQCKCDDKEKDGELDCAPRSLDSPPPPRTWGMFLKIQ